MRHTSLFLIAIISLLFLAVACKSDSDGSRQDSPTADPGKWTEVADVIVQRAALLEGEKVLLVIEPGEYDGLVPLLENRVKEAGGEYLGCASVSSVQPENWTTDYIRGLEGLSGAALETYLSEIDLGIMLPGAEPSDDIYAAIQNILTSGSKRTIHFHWAGAYDMRQQEIAVDEEIGETYRQAVVGTDYTRLSKIQLLLEAEMRDNPLLVTTPDGTEISFRVGDRPVTRQDGDASADRARQARNLIDREIELPAGAVRVAPLENTVNGTIVFPPGVWGGVDVSGLEMTFVNGRLTAWSADEGADGVERELDEGGSAARAFREFALGVNPLLAIPEGDPWIPYYGYGAGVVRLSLGDNSELGGDVSGGYTRWNFFTDATVRIGDEKWVENGKLLVQ